MASKDGVDINEGFQAEVGVGYQPGEEVGMVGLSQRSSYESVFEGRRKIMSEERAQTDVEAEGWVVT